MLVAILLAAPAACGGEPSADPTRDASVTASDLPAPAPTTEGNGSLVPPLPSLTVTAKPTRTAVGRVFGADVSWPQCPKGMGIPEKRTEGKPMPTSAARFVVLGLTNGPSFVANPCLESQLAWVIDRHLRAAAYSIVSYPDDGVIAQLGGDGPFDGATRLGALRNVGYQAALFNIATMKRVGLTTPVVWIDVEPVLHFDWSPDLRANGAVVQGTARGYQDGGFRIGFYSIGSLWTRVVGSLRFGAPEWRPAGERGLDEALSRCGPDWSFQGGAAVLGQWVEDARDRDVTCPGAVADLGHWFHQY
ncbi:MAG: hypothetical protein QOF00_1776 [Pseudonocardiales bacterium]|nr:hypothetical protein [Pseudonocardiales bacterium]